MCHAVYDSKALDVVALGIDDVVVDLEVDRQMDRQRDGPWL